MLAAAGKLPEVIEKIHYVDRDGKCRHCGKYFRYIMCLVVVDTVLGYNKLKDFVLPAEILRCIYYALCPPLLIIGFKMNSICFPFSVIPVQFGQIRPFTVSKTILSNI